MKCSVKHTFRKSVDRLRASAIFWHSFVHRISCRYRSVCWWKTCALFVPEIMATCRVLWWFCWAKRASRASEIDKCARSLESNNGHRAESRYFVCVCVCVCTSHLSKCEEVVFVPDLTVEMCEIAKVFKCHKYVAFRCCCWLYENDDAAGIWRNAQYYHYIYEWFVHEAASSSYSSSFKQWTLALICCKFCTLRCWLCWLVGCFTNTFRQQ